MDMKIDIKDDGLIDRLKRSPTTFKDKRVSFLEEALNYLLRLVVLNTPIGGTRLLRSSHFITPIKGVGESLTGSVTTTSLYGEAVEIGTVPHMPPISPLKLWVKNKLKVSGEKAIKSAAWAVAMKIKAKGTEGAFMYKKAMEAGESHIQSKQDKLARDIAKAITK